MISTDVEAKRNSRCPCGSGKRYKHCCGSIAAPVAAAVPTVEAVLAEALRCHQSGRLNDAEALYGQVLRLDAKNGFALQYLGVLALQRGDPVRGEALVRKSLEVCPDVADFHNNLGLCLRQQNRLEEAIMAYRDALRLNPDYPEGENNLGLDLLALGRAREAASHCERALALRPAFAEAHWNLALSLLTLGEFERGWAEYEWRLRCQPFAKDGLLLDQVALWQGEPLAGKTLLIRREQGFGDTFQFIRFVPELLRRGARVLLDVRQELADVAMSVCPGIERVSRDHPLPAVDYYSNLLSLPCHLGVTAADLPGRIPYLEADVHLVQAWRQRLEGLPGLKVGLVWSGSPGHQNDRNRSCPPGPLAALRQVPGLTWFSLQKGPASAPGAAKPFANMIDLGPELDDFSATAAAIGALDLIVCVDTAVAHLAGALGRPVWVLLPFAAEWRWLQGRDDSPWYPEARLFRQPAPGDWPGLAGKVAQALAELTAARRPEDAGHWR